MCVLVMRENHIYFLTILISISSRVLAWEVCGLSHPELDPGVCSHQRDGGASGGGGKGAGLSNYKVFKQRGFLVFLGKKYLLPGKRLRRRTVTASRGRGIWNIKNTLEKFILIRFSPFKLCLVIPASTSQTTSRTKFESWIKEFHYFFIFIIVLCVLITGSVTRYFWNLCIIYFFCVNHRVGIGLTVFSYFFKLIFCVNHRVVGCREHLSYPVAGVGDPLPQRDLVSVSRVGLEEGGGTMERK